jgi:hypothetical protein
LVLDNFEHLLEAASEMSGLIEACPGPTVLATSRAPLHIRGEQEYPVPSLRLPASTRSPAREEVVNAPSGHLFVERALAHEDALTLTGRAKALTVIAGLVYPQGDLHRHAAFAEEGARLAREIEDREVLAMATYLGGHAAFVRGDLARAAALVGESEALYRALGDEPGTGLALALLGRSRPRRAAIRRRRGAAAGERIVVEPDRQPQHTRDND